MENPDSRLARMLWSPEMRVSPLLFVRTVYPWGKPNTELANIPKERSWQTQELLRFGEYLQHQSVADAYMTVYKRAVASGRGIGKSTLLAWLAHYVVSVFPGASVIISANGEPQLRSYTWPELGKWINMSVNSHWFDISSSTVSPKKWLADSLRQSGRDVERWYIMTRLWSLDNPSSYAGAHNMNGILLLFDEASGIPTPIWEVAEGYFTESTPLRGWFALSNPRCTSGFFRNCFTDNSGWGTRNIDSRTVEGLDKRIFDDLIERYGATSDFAKTEVMGEFPQGAYDTLIGYADYEKAARINQRPEFNPAPLIAAADVTAGGKDATVIRCRRGLDARSIPPVRLEGLKPMEIQARLVEFYYKVNPDIFVIDGGGIGKVYVDYLKNTIGAKIHEFDGSKAAHRPEYYLNRRAEVWCTMRDWMPDGCIDENKDLARDLTTPRLVDNGTTRIQLESKEHIKSRGERSPDEGDALAMTFAVDKANIMGNNGNKFKIGRYSKGFNVYRF